MATLDEMIKIFEELKGDGIKQVDIEKLIEFTKSFKNDHEINKERENQFFIESVRAQNESNLEMFRSVISYGQASLKYGILLCGSSAVALLAFVGSVAEKHIEWVKPCINSIAVFTLGAAVVTLCVFLTYLTQFCYANAKSKWQIAGHILCGVTWLFGFVVLLVFLTGMWLFWRIF